MAWLDLSNVADVAEAPEPREELTPVFDAASIRAAVAARVAAEAKTYGTGEAGPEPGRQEVPARDILSAAEEGQQGAAWLFASVNKDRFLFDHAAGIWHEWQGHFWTRDGIGEPVKSLDEVSDLFRTEYDAASQRRADITAEIAAAKADLIGSDDKDAIEKRIKDLGDKEKTFSRQQATLLKAISSLQFLGYRKQVVEFAAQGVGSLGYDGTGWDTTPMVLACPNGVLELATGVFRPGRPSDYIKTACPTPYDPNAKADAWEQFLLASFDGDADLVGYIRRLLGYAITGCNNEHVLPVFWGKGRNGKGTLLETLASVLGDYVGPVQAEMLLDQGRGRSSAGPSPDIMALRGRRLAWASETKEGRRMDSGKVKWLVGGDTLVGRPPYGRFEIRFAPTHTLILMTNNKPHAPADDFALWQRIHLVPFNLCFVDNPRQPNERKRDRSLVPRLQGEASGILNWLVLGALEWKREGLNPPAVVRDATDEYRRDEDTLQHFIDECCCIGVYESVGGNHFYEAYKNWCSENEIRPLTGTNFGRKVSERFTKEKSGVVRYTGVGLLR